MFHEFYFIISCWDKLRKKIIEQDSEVVVPRLRGTPDQLKKLEVPNFLTIMTSLARIGGKRPRLTE